MLPGSREAPGVLAKYTGLFQCWTKYKVLQASKEVTYQNVRHMLESNYRVSRETEAMALVRPRILKSEAGYQSTFPHLVGGDHYRIFDMEYRGGSTPYNGWSPYFASDEYGGLGTVQVHSVMIPTSLYRLACERADERDQRLSFVQPQLTYQSDAEEGEEEVPKGSSGAA